MLCFMMQPSVQFRLCFEVVIVAVAAVLVLTLSSRAGHSAAEGPSDQAGRYLILHASHLRDAAEAWADYRRAGGWRVTAREFEPGLSASDVQSRIRAFNHASISESNDRGPLFILLLGDADEDGIPTFYFDQTDSSLHSKADDRYASDHPYQLANDRDDLDDFALGRVPARTNEEALVLLEKIRRYEHSSPGDPARRRVTYAAGEGRFGSADRLLEQMFELMVRRFVPPEFEISMTYANANSMYCPSPDRLVETSLARLGEGALLYNYVGHGHATGFDALNDGTARHRVLDARHLDELLETNALRPVALLACCSTGWYDLPDGESCMAEAMLFHPAGPIAVIAGSRLTHPYANVIIQKDVTEFLLCKRVETIGELDARAMRSMAHVDAADRQIDLLAMPIARSGAWPSTLRELRDMHVKLYNLLGDPALRIAHPLPSAMTLQIKGGILTGTSSRVFEGSVRVRLETDLAEIANPDALLPVDGSGTLRLDERARTNYVLSNDRTLLELNSRMEAGQLEVALPKPMPARARWIRVDVVEDDVSGDADYGVLCME